MAVNIAITVLQDVRLWCSRGVPGFLEEPANSLFRITIKM